MTRSHSGGCQCGAVRYRLSGEVDDPHLCHCRMCQKAAGNYFMAIGSVDYEDFEITRGEIAKFKSSDEVSRGFCQRCGTPLTFEIHGDTSLGIALGSLDDPTSVPPTSTCGTESKMPWLNEVCVRDGRTTEEEDFREGERIREVKASNRQHPDHDTETWNLSDD